MATRLYLSSDLNIDDPFNDPDAPTSGEKSTALPVGIINSSTPANYRLSTTIDTAQNSSGFSSIASTTQQSGVSNRWYSKKLTAQTVSANTWTFFFAATESNNAANAFTSLSVYIWDPVGSSVRGFLYDNSATLGTEWGTSVSAQSVTFSGSAVTASDNDFLVIEWWNNATHSMATSYILTFYWGGTDDVTTGTGNNSVATYLETPQNLNFKKPTSSTIFIM